LGTLAQLSQWQQGNYSQTKGDSLEVNTYAGAKSDRHGNKGKGAMTIANGFQGEPLCF
jgi:hypothetical protein